MWCCRINTSKRQQCEPQNQRKPYHQKSGSRNYDKKASLQAMVIFQLQRHFRKVPLKQKWNASLHVEIFRKDSTPAPLEGVVFDQLVRSNLKLPLQPHFTEAFTIRRRDGCETVKKTTTETIIVRFRRQHNNFAHASHFFYISLPFLHEYDVKLPNFTFYGRRKQATTILYFSF